MNNTSHSRPATSEKPSGDLTVWVISTVLTQTVCGIGLVSNFLGFITIFGQRLYKKAPIFIYFGYIAFIDLIHVIMVALTETNLLYTITDSSNPRSWANNKKCSVLTYFNWLTADLSGFLVIMAHAYKLYGMLRPFSFMQKDTKFAVVVSCGIITTIVFAIDSHLLWTASITTVDDSYVCHMGDDYPKVRQIAFMYVLIVICGVSPGLLIIFASAIGLTFFKNYKEHRKLMGENSDGKNDTQKSATYETAKNSVVMLLPICIVQLVGTVPFGIIMYVSYADASFDASLAFTVVAFLNHSNYAFNVILQFIASKFYRNALLGRLS